MRNETPHKIRVKLETRFPCLKEVVVHELLKRLIERNIGSTFQPLENQKTQPGACGFIIKHKLPQNKLQPSFIDKTYN
jgi:hypothetical protein